MDSPIGTFFIQRHAEQDEETLRREKWTDFADNTTLHGFHFIFTRASPWVRLVWIFFVLGFTGYVIFSIYNSIYKYFTYPIATVMNIYHPKEGLQFPAVTLCPMTTLSKRKISMRDEEPSFNKLGLNIAACNITAAVRAGRPCGEALLCCCADYSADSEISVVLPNCTEDYRKDLLEVIQSKKDSFNDRQFHEAYGSDIRRMIVPRTCQYGLSDEGCSHKDFDPVVTDLGVCYSFNAARHGEQVLKAFQGDTLSGLSLVLDLNLNDHMVGSSSEGIWIIVHHQGVYINPWNRILVAPGTRTEISVKRKVVSTWYMVAGSELSSNATRHEMTKWRNSSTGEGQCGIRVSVRFKPYTLLRGTYCRVSTIKAKSSVVSCLKHACVKEWKLCHHSAYNCSATGFTR